LISQRYIKECLPGLSPGALCRSFKLRRIDAESCF